MTIGQFAFIVLSTLTIVGAGLAVILRNVTHAVLSLVLFFFGIASLFFLLRADYIGVIQILIYVGAVAVLIVFAIVLTRSDTAAEDFRSLGGVWWVGAFVAAIVGGLLTGLILRSDEVLKFKTENPTGSVEEVGRALMTQYALPFEVASILLTAALIGSVVIAMEEIKKRMHKK